MTRDSFLDLVSESGRLALVDTGGLDLTRPAAFAA
jgi:hypothetical protein